MSGIAALGKLGIKEVAVYLQKESDPAGRSACLDLCYTLYTALGSDMSKLTKLFGDSMNERSASMVSESLVVYILHLYFTHIVLYMYVNRSKSVSSKSLANTAAPHQHSLAPQLLKQPHPSLNSAPLHYPLPLPSPVQALRIPCLSHLGEYLS